MLFKTKKDCLQWLIWTKRILYLNTPREKDLRCNAYNRSMSEKRICYFTFTDDDGEWTGSHTFKAWTKSEYHNRTRTDSKWTCNYPSLLNFAPVHISLEKHSIKLHSMNHSLLSQDNKDFHYLVTVLGTTECCCVNAFKLPTGCGVFLIWLQKCAN